MSRSSSANRNSKNPFRHYRSFLQVERLEDRVVPTVNLVYNSANAALLVEAANSASAPVDIFASAVNGLRASVSAKP